MNPIKTIAALAISFLCMQSASAQWAVFDASAYAKHVENKIIQGKQLAEQTRIYQQQIQEYQAQLQQLNLEKVAGQVFDTGGFEKTLSSLDSYKEAININQLNDAIQQTKKSEEFVTGGFSTEDYLEKLSTATDTKIELTKSLSQLNEKRQTSITQDKVVLENLTAANSSAVGQMQAAQIGNHINSEVVAQLLKIRQEQAMESEIIAQEKALALEQEEARKAWLADHSERSKESIQKIKDQNSLRSEENKKRY